MKSALAVLAAVGLAWGLYAGEDNPYKKAKAGDWVSYKTLVEHSMGKMESTMKQTVTAKDDKFVTISLEMSTGGQAMPAQEQKIPLDQPFDPSKAPPGAKIEKIGEGDEKLTLGDKTYACHWVENKITMDMGEQKMTSQSKIWMCPDVPLGGMVKMTNSMEAPMKSKTVMEITGSGTK